MNESVLIAGLFIGLGTALLGSLVILKKLALVSDALSHVALPGLAVALIVGLNPFLGAVVFLVGSVLLIGAIQKKFHLATETLVGILFTTALAVGILLVPSEELLESLFGNISQISSFDIGLAVVGGSLLFLVTLLLYRRFVKVMISPELSRSEFINVNRTELIFLIILALGVALGIKTIGTLLMGALIILPAATAKNLSSNLKQMALLSVIISLVSIGFGFWFSTIWQSPPGPTVVLLSSVIFAVSLIK